MMGLKQLCDNGDETPTWQPKTPPDVEKMAKALQTSLETIEALERRVKLLETKLVPLLKYYLFSLFHRN